MDCTICHFEIPCEDPAAAGEFYSALFGWKLVAVPNMEQEYLLIQTSEKKGALGGGLCKRSPGHASPLVYVTVADIDAAAERLGQLGGSVVMPKTAIPRVGWVLTATDPQGNTLGLIQQDAEVGGR